MKTAIVLSVTICTPIATALIPAVNRIIFHWPRVNYLRCCPISGPNLLYLGHLLGPHR